MPTLKEHSFYQITQGNISIWSSPWCTTWENIYDHLIVQHSAFIYPAKVSDLWLPGQKLWNSEFITNLFQEPTASAIIATPIVLDDSRDILCWKPTPSGKCNSKSTYKLCLQQSHNLQANQPGQVNQSTKDILQQVWKHKFMAPRVKTFAWRLLRHALPTGLRAGRFSSHISSTCSRCDSDEDEMHLFFLCNFARASWFGHPWYIRSDILALNHNSVLDIIQVLINMHHPQASIPNIFTFLWCLWKARNDVLFCRKESHPHQVHQAALAIASIQDMQDPQEHLNRELPSSKEKQSTTILSQGQEQVQQGSTLKSDLAISGTKIYSDASWHKKNVPGYGGNPATGIGVHILFPKEGSDSRIMIQASTHDVCSPLIAEVYALLFAAKISCRLQLQQGSFLTDNLSLAKMAASRDINNTNISWRCRQPISEFFQISHSLNAVYHISRNTNGIAHNCAHQVLNSRVEPVFSCSRSSHANVPCPFLQSLLNFQVQGYVIHAVHCL